MDLNAESISEDGREFVLHEANTYGCDAAINSIVIVADAFLYFMGFSHDSKNSPGGDS